MVNKLSETSPKRILTKGQSKGGCKTCRARKIKCDEFKPRCMRCFQSHRNCEGYGVSEQRSSLLGVSSSTMSDTGGVQTTVPPSTKSFTAYLEPALLSHIGLTSLMKDSPWSYSVGKSSWKALLERHGNASPGARAACVALGAAKELQFGSTGAKHYLQEVYHQQYGISLARLREDLDTGSPRVPSALTTCFILAFAEVLFRRRQNAFHHIRAIFRLVRNTYETSGDLEKDFFDKASSLKSGIDLAADMNMLLHVTDIQIMSYSHGVHPPALPSREMDDLGEEIQSSTAKVACTEALTIRLIHRAWSFISIAAREAAKGCEIDQSICDQLQTSLIRAEKSLRFSMPSGNTTLHSREYGGLVVLRSHCLSLSVLLPSLLETTELCWTKHESHLESIIEMAANLLESKAAVLDPDRRAAAISFQPHLGLCSPLFLAALKHRGTSFRRRAIQCLRQIGLEGPWNGVMCAAVAERCGQIESSAPSADDIGKQLVSLCVLVESNGETDGRTAPSSSAGSTLVRFYRRRRPIPLVYILLPSSSHHRNVGLSSNLDAWEEFDRRVDFAI